MASLRIAQIIKDTEAEGPGRRYAVWVQGCTIRCPGCCNPEMFGERGGREVTARELIDEAKTVGGLEGISVLGGEPCEQPEGVAELCELAQAEGLTTMLYSGYTLEELKGPRHSAQIDRLLAAVDLFADGRYDQTKPEKVRRWLGSSNQKLHFFTGRYREDDPRFVKPNTVELRLENGKLTINGWPSGANAFRKR